MTVHGYILVAVGLVSVAYLFAAETFTHFLYPEHGVVAAYFQAGALPTGVFIAVIALFILAITGGWFFVYADRMVNAHATGILADPFVFVLRKPPLSRRACPET